MWYYYRTILTKERNTRSDIGRFFASRNLAVDVLHFLYDKVSPVFKKIATWLSSCRIRNVRRYSTLMCKIFFREYRLVVFILLYTFTLFFFQLFVNKNSVKVTVIQTVIQGMDPFSISFGTISLIWTFWKWQVKLEPSPIQQKTND